MTVTTRENTFNPNLWKLSIFHCFFSGGLMAGTMNLTLLKSPKELTPFNYFSLNEWYVHSNITANLVELDRENQVVSSLATSWRVSADGKEYSFKLDLNRKWSDGSPITAQEILESFTQDFRHANARYLLKLLESDPSKSVVLKGGDTLVFSLRFPHEKFLYHLARPEFGIFDLKAFKKKRNFTMDERTSGVYKIDAISDKALRLSKNPHVQIDPRSPSEIEFRVLNNHTDVLESIKKGKVDFFEIQSEDAETLATQSGHYQIVDGGFDNLATLQARKVTREQRKALTVLNQFLDRNLFISGAKKPASRLVAMSEVPQAKASPVLTVNEAKKQLGGKTFKFNLHLSNEVTSDQIQDAKKIRAEAKRIGIEISFVEGGPNFRKEWEKENYELTMARMGVYAYDEVELMNGYFCETFPPYRVFRPLLCEEIGKAAQTIDSTPERKALLQSVYDKIMNSGYVIMLYHFPRKYLIHRRWSANNINTLIPYPIFTRFRKS